ncbi:choice-of-anchor D domain-containing protein [Simiduia aestuariiviva]|uniref:HYDIN/VesB/CFA65-like Ig-like domain-containing protein n=1 Tax=Simiduia aestuariiviva TaxID=1510459 RepID=A0A839UMH5_9GAMM|nr:choice-of-anchor D domain-containing protein [Simiduia aestuariiviva]MBB3167749.1 hypothetical protein [Simiduia aestuariiviva]
MRSIVRPLMYCLVSASLTSAAFAETLFNEDFQDANANGWAFSGYGTAYVTVYAGNYSLRLTRQRTADQSMSSAGYDNVQVAMQFAASSLEYGETCVGEVSTDGQTWQRVITVYDGQDNGVTLYSGYLAPIGGDNNDNVQLRLRASGNSTGDYCWADNILVTGDVMSAAPDIQISGALDFGDVAVGASAQQSVTVSNLGNADLHIGAVSAPANPFSVSTDTCAYATLAPQGQCQVTLAFAPTTTGSVSDLFTINSDDPDMPAADVQLLGNGIAAQAVYDPLTGNGNVNRTALSYASLNGGSVSLMDYSAYALPANGANPQHNFEGNLTLFGEATNGSFVERGTSLAYAYTDPGHLPEFSFDFVQHGTHLIPVQRGLIATSHPSWSYILEPGRVWQEDGDNGYSRVSLPFSLQENGANCTHNGVMSFAFKDDGSITKVAYQIAAETCAYFKYDMWGLLSASYAPAAVSGAVQLQAQYETEVANRMMVKPISELAVDYPAAGINTATLGSEQSADHRTVFGVAIAGVHYAGGCDTRQGTYPHCDVLDIPSYSTAKSTVGAIGLMRLEQKYAGVQKDLPLSNWVGECSGSQWTGVTFEHALDMATGNYDSSGFEVDEASTTTSNDFFLKYTHAEKVAHSCAYPRKSAPGSLWVYHTSDTYLLGRAMNMFYQSQAGAGQDFYADLLVPEIWQPLGLSPVTYTSLRTFDSQSQVLAGYGLTYHRDDVIKLAEFLAQADGKINGQSLLDTAMLDESMQRTGDHGLSAGSVYDRYQNGFWAWNAKDAMNCSSDVWVPYMSGYGGLSVVMLPNDITYYMFSDNNEYSFVDSAKELNKIQSLCQ